jgi:hypothetical protein
MVAGPKAWAQTKDEKLEKAKVHFNRAIKYFNEGNYKDALIDFEASYTYRPHWKLKFNMAWCHYQLSHIVKAATLLSEFLKEGGDSIKDEDREKAQQVLSDLKTKLATLILMGEIEGAKIEIDGHVLGGVEEGEEIFLEPGKHEVHVSSKNAELVGEEINFKAGENKEIRVKLLVVGEEEEEASGGQEKESETIEVQTDMASKSDGGGKDRLAVGGWATLALGSAMLAAAVVTGGLAGREKALMQDSEDEYHDAFPDPSVSDEELADIKADRDNHDDKGMAMLYTMAGLLAAGGLTFAASITLLAISKKKKTETPVFTEAGLSFGPGSIQLRLSF